MNDETPPKPDSPPSSGTAPPPETKEGGAAAQHRESSAPEPGTDYVEALRDAALAAIGEQRSARRWRVALRISLLLLLAWALVLCSRAGRDFETSLALKSSPPEQEHTAIINIYGVIGIDASDAESLNANLREAFANDEARGVILRISSNGGLPAHAALVYDEILRLKAEYKKPVHAVVVDSCASAAYYIASAADEIHAVRSSIIGSIGVRLDSFGFVELMREHGIERRILQAGDDKVIFDPFLPFQESHRRHLQEILDDIHRQFIDDVQRARGARFNASDQELFNGFFWTGERAFKLGMIDSLDNLESVARDRIKAEETHLYNQANPFDRYFQGSLSGLVDNLFDRLVGGSGAPAPVF